MITVFLIVSILLPLALVCGLSWRERNITNKTWLVQWTRPPNIVIGNVQAVSNGSEVNCVSQLSLEANITCSIDPASEQRRSDQS